MKAIHIALMSPIDFPIVLKYFAIDAAIFLALFFVLVWVGHVFFRYFVERK